MEHLVKENPNHCRLSTGELLTGVPTVDERLSYHFGLEIPHQLERKLDGRCRMRMIFPSDRSMSTGDMIVNEWGKERVVTEILERRKARGDWSKNPFDEAPDFVEVTYL